MIAVLDYGMGNLRSVARAVERVGGKPEISDEPEAVDRADALIVPGVGHFGMCMRNLARGGLDRAVQRFASSGRPLFGVCLGMQVLFDRSEESPEEGLGVLTGASRRLPASVKVPHMGWNTVEWTGRHAFLGAIPSGTLFYFVHSYAPEPAAATVGVTEHGRAFASVVARENVFATQFHPEKSSEAGLALYEAFVREAAA